MLMETLYTNTTVITLRSKQDTIYMKVIYQKHETTKIQHVARFLCWSESIQHTERFTSSCSNISLVHADKVECLDSMTVEKRFERVNDPERYAGGSVSSW
jgi:hypothetical protein